MSGGWAGSSRRAELPSDWPKIRAAILDRDRRRCQWPTGTGVCGKRATDVDHIGDRDDHRPENLQALCRWHHGRKTSEQGNRSGRRVVLSERRPSERHPGLS